MNPYGCHNRTIGAGYFVKVREYIGYNYQMVDKWIPHTMSTDCRYDQKTLDERCRNCKHTS